MKNIKGVILAGGTGSRLYPLTKVTNKHLLPVYNKPMVYYPLKTLTDAGAKDIVIISGPGHAGHFLNLLGSGKEFNVRLKYEIQDEAGGIAQALSLAEDFIDNEKFMVILGDNIFEDNMKNQAQEFLKSKFGAKIFLKQVVDPTGLGVAEIKGDRVIGIEEKPAKPKSNFIVTGLYMYDGTVFDIIKTLKPSKRGELEITDVNNIYLKQGMLTYSILKGYWGDAGTFNSLFEASKMIKDMEESLKTKTT